jgi:hypothetical protein
MAGHGGKIMTSHNHHRQRNRDKLRPSRLFLGMLFFTLGACTAQSAQETQATSRQSTDDITPGAELPQRAERSATIPSGLERVPGTSPAVPVTGEAPSALLDAIIADLMTRKNIKREEIAVTRAEAVIWPDGSLGCPRPGEMYTQATVEGYWIVLRWAEKEFDYRASAKGQFLLCKNTFKVRRPVG